MFDPTPVRLSSLPLASADPPHPLFAFIRNFIYRFPLTLTANSIRTLLPRFLPIPPMSPAYTIYFREAKCGKRISVLSPSSSRSHFPRRHFFSILRSICLYRTVSSLLLTAYRPPRFDVLIIPNGNGICARAPAYPADITVV